MADWLVAKTTPTLGDGCVAELKRRNVEYINAREQLSVLRNGRIVQIRRPIFPTYLFVLAPDYFYHLLTIPNIIGLVASPVTHEPWRSIGLDRFINKLKRSLNQDQIIMTQQKQKRRTRYMRGDRIRTIKGLFAGRNGQVSESTNAHRVRVELEGLFAKLTINDEDLIVTEETRLN